MTRSLPPRPHIQHLSKQAKELRRAQKDGSDDAIRRILEQHPRYASLSGSEVQSGRFGLNDAQLVIAREYGFDSWPKLRQHVEAVALDFDQRVAAAIESSLSGDLAKVGHLLQLEPTLGRANFYVACVLGDANHVRSTLGKSPSLATERGGPRNWVPLLYACFSRHLGQHAPLAESSPGPRPESLVEVARVLLEAGADPNSFYRVNDDPNAKQTALYGAAGVANDSAMTKLLLDAGADPNDDAPGLGPESLYHAAESPDHECLRLILEAGPDRDKVSYCLGRKLDFHDPEGVRVFLEYGADPNFEVPRQKDGTRLHTAVRRGHGAETIELLVEHGARIDAKTESGRSAYALAVRTGNLSAAEALLRHGANEDEASSTDRFLGACCRGDRNLVATLLQNDPNLIKTLGEEDRRSIADAAQRSDLKAVRLLLESGFDPSFPGDEQMSALHWACWKGNPEMVELVLAYEPALEEKNGYGGTALDCAVYGAVHCHDPSGGSTANQRGDRRDANYVAVVELLLSSGADVRAVSPFPSGNEAVDTLLRPLVEAVDREGGSTVEDGELATHDHVQRSGEFFGQFALPETRIPLRAWLGHQVDSLVEGHAAADSRVAMTIHLSFPPGKRPNENEIFSSSFTREDAQQIIALAYSFQSWDQVEEVGDRELDPQFEAAVDAVIHGRTQQLRGQLDESPNLVDDHSPFAHRAMLLHYVAANGVEIHRQRTPSNAAEITQALLDAGAEPDALCESYGGGRNETPLCLAVSSHHPFAAKVQGDIAGTLLDGGARVNGLDDDSMPLATAVAFGYLDTANVLVRRGARVDNLVLAAGLGRLDLARSLVDPSGEPLPGHPYLDPFGVRVESPQALKDWALFAASKHGHYEVVRYLTERGADVEAAPRRGETAMHLAAYHGHLDIVRFLVEQGASPSRVDQQWNATPQVWAVEGGHEEIAAYLRPVGGVE